ncbi:MAG: cytochrome b N-terminal domain-containing protein [Candidatus Riflebacteria bacterium]|nr:cytochrome b N-terminal domain-containing protein [Candidatus Riflebacteria bacterium]
MDDRTDDSGARTPATPEAPGARDAARQNASQGGRNPGQPGLSLTWLDWIGPVLLALVVAQMATGTLLSLHYRAVPEAAWESVEYLEKSAGCGRLIRAFHSWGATAMVVALSLHMARVFLLGTFRRPRHFCWFSGALLWPVILITSFTGYLLPWNAKGFYAAQVASNMIASTPVVGEPLQLLLMGDDSLGALALTRFHAVHVTLFPFALGLGLLWHLWLASSTGVRTRRDLVAALLALVALLGLAAWWPAPLEMRAAEAPAGYVPRPEWYFLPLFQLLHYLPGDWIVLGTIVIPAVLLGALLFWPWLERSPSHRPSERKWTLGGAAALVYAGFVLVVLGSLESEAPPPPPPPVSVADKQTGPPVVGRQSEGHRLFVALGCAFCHEKGGAPDISLLGSKIERDWTRDYLLAPRRLRWERQDQRPLLRMPDYKLTVQEAADLAEMLEWRRDSSRFPALPPGPVAPRAIAQGAKLFAERRCPECHVYQGKGGRIGPDLTDVAHRLKAEYLQVFLTEPSRFARDNPMTHLRLAAEDALALTRFLTKEKGDKSRR